MGKKQEKSITHEREKAGSINQDIEDELIKSSEPYICTGNFLLDFRRLCAKSQMAPIPEVRPRPHLPISLPPTLVIEEKIKTGKVGKDKTQPPPVTEPESEIQSANETSEPLEVPPKTYTTKDKFEYFRPCVQVETEHVDKQDFVTEVYIRGWKIDVSMMNILGQCWVALPKLQSVCLWNTGLDNDTLQMLGSVICSCPNLKSLFLDNNPVKSEAWQLLIAENSSVQHLSLRYCNITDVGAENLGKAVGTTEKQNQKLLSLNLTGNKITDTGAEHLANGLRMNRTLLSLCLGGNCIGDKGACKLAEVISRFPLKHEEVVMRRTLILSNADRKIVTPLLSSRKGDGHDRPGSVRSQVSSQAGGSKGKPGKGAKKSDYKTGKEEDSKHDKSKTGKVKDMEKTPKKASGTPETGKPSGKKSEGKKGRKMVAPSEPEAPEGTENQNPLLESVEHLGNGVILLQGNFTLISLNLANNEIGEKGISAFLKALQYQATLSEFHSAKLAAEDSMTVVSKSPKESISAIPVNSKFLPKGLLRLCLQRNKVPMENEDLKIISSLMSTRDPLLKLSEFSTDQK